MQRAGNSQCIPGLPGQKTPEVTSVLPLQLTLMPQGSLLDCPWLTMTTCSSPLCSFHSHWISWSSLPQRFFSLIALTLLWFLIIHGFCFLSCLQLSTSVLLLPNTHYSKMQNERETDRLMVTVNCCLYFGTRPRLQLETGSGAHLWSNSCGQGGKVVWTIFLWRKPLLKYAGLL